MVPLAQQFNPDGQALRSVSVRVSPISRTAAILIIVIGIITLLAGLSTGVLASTVAGAAFIVLGVFLYALLYRLRGNIRREIDEVDSG